MRNWYRKLRWFNNLTGEAIVQNLLSRDVLLWRVLIDNYNCITNNRWAIPVHIKAMIVCLGTNQTQYLVQWVCVQKFILRNLWYISLIISTYGNTPILPIFHLFKMFLEILRSQLLTHSMLFSTPNVLLESCIHMTIQESIYFQSSKQ